VYTWYPVPVILLPRNSSFSSAILQVKTQGFAGSVQCSDAGSFLKSVKIRKISSEHEQKWLH